MTATSVVNVMPSNKLEVQSFAEKVKSSILSGYEDPLKIASQLKAMEEVIETLREDKEIREVVLKQAEKEGIKTFRKYNSEFQIKETGTKYDYSVCDDPEFEKIQKEFEGIQTKLKARQKFLQSLTKQVADPETGAIINPPVKTSTTVVTVKLF